MCWQALSTLTHVNPSELWEHGYLFEGPAFFSRNQGTREVRSNANFWSAIRARPSNKAQTTTLTVGGAREGCEEVTATGWDRRGRV